MLRMISVYGVVAGLIVGIPMCVMAVTWQGHPPLTFSMAIGYLTMLLALSTVFVAIKRHRDADLGGVIKFWPALGVGLSISAVASVLYVLSWEATQALTHMDFAGGYARRVIEEQQAKGASAAALARVSAEMEQFKLQYARLSYRLPMTFAEIFPVGVLVSLISAGLLRNSRFFPLRRV